MNKFAQIFFMSTLVLIIGIICLTAYFLLPNDSLLNEYLNYFLNSQNASAFKLQQLTKVSMILDFSVFKASTRLFSI